MTPAYLAKLIKSLPETADGFPIFPGMVVYLLCTTDAGHTWWVSGEKKVTSVYTRQMACLNDDDEILHAPQMGDNRIYRSALAANKERKKRNQPFRGKAKLV